MRQHRCSIGLVEAAHGIGVNAGGVDHHARAQGKGFPRFGVLRGSPLHAPCRLLQAGNRQVVEAGGTEIGGCAHQRDGQAGIVELRIPVAYAAGELISAQAGQGGQRFAVVEQARRRDVAGAGEQVIELQAGAEFEFFNDAAGGDDEGQRPHQRCGIFKQTPPFEQGMAHQRQVALAQVAHTAMDQLGAARGRAAGEVAALKQQRTVAARGGIDGATEAGGATADDEHVPAIACAQPGQ